MLTNYEQDGLAWERQVNDALVDAGLSSYLIYINPLTNEAAWQKVRGQGRDMELMFPNGRRVQIECKWMSSDYSYRLNWCMSDIVPRFNSGDPNCIDLVITNRPDNINKSASIQSAIANKFMLSFSVLSLCTMVTTLLSIANDCQLIHKRVTALINSIDNRVWINGVVTFELKLPIDIVKLECKLPIDKLISQLSVSLIGNVNE